MAFIMPKTFPTAMKSPGSPITVANGDDVVEPLLYI
jgi:hypothetical protein